MPIRDHSAAPHTSAIRNIKIAAIIRGQGIDIRGFLGCHNLRLGLPQPVFDAFMDHLDKMA